MLGDDGLRQLKVAGFVPHFLYVTNQSRVVHRHILCCYWWGRGGGEGGRGGEGRGGEGEEGEGEGEGEGGGGGYLTTQHTTGCTCTVADNIKCISNSY